MNSEYKPDNQFIRPDFMTRNQFRQHCYLSRNILGEFYRQCCLIENIVLNTDTFSPDLQEHVECEKKLIVPGLCLLYLKFF